MYVFITLLIWALFFQTVSAEDSSTKKNNIQMMSLADLGNIEMRSATLTTTEKRKVPATVTRITQEDIENAQARGLDELLKIYVPGVQSMKKSNNGDQLGIRGIISDRNNKFLILVNGKVMNEKTEKGAITERALSMLGDIQYIDVIRGPGSVLYGPGALAGIINIVTHTGETFNGAEFKVRQGFGEDFNSFEMKLGHTFDDKSNIFFFYGIDNYTGANNSNAPDVFGHSFSTSAGNTTAGHSTPLELQNSNGAYRNRARHKAHIQFKVENLELFLRYTRGGKVMLPNKNQIINKNTDLLQRSYGYQQLTFVVDYKQDISDVFWLDYRLSYDMLDSESELGNALHNYREDEYYGRIMANWQPVAEHQMALGVEYSHEKFGKTSPGFPNTDPKLPGGLGKTSPWASDTMSFFGEHQWKINEEFTTFLGLRMDQTDYTSELLSGRAALIYTPTVKDTLKLIYNHSVRRIDESDLRRSELNDQDTGATETFDNYEFRYERQHSPNFWSGFSAFYANYEVISFSFNGGGTIPLGTLQYFGLELENVYQTDKYKVSLSHSFIKHHNFESSGEGIINNVTSSHLGSGNDLANWYNHQTTLSGHYNLNERWKVTSSLRVLWGLPGGKDLAKFNVEDNMADKTLPQFDEDYDDRAWQESIFLNMGLEYQPTDNLTLRLDAYNVMGWADKDYNKINEFQRTDHYQNQAASIVFSLKYKF